MSNLKKAIKAIGDAVVDLTELRVQTVTGDVQAVIKTKKLENLEKLLLPSGTGTNKVDAKLNLVLDTTIKFDGDSLNFIDVNKATPDLVSLHKEAIASGLKHRQGLVEMFKGIIDVG